MFATMITEVFVLGGSNMYQPRLQLREAMLVIDQSIACLTNASSVFKTQAWGNTQQPAFYNQVWQVTSAKNPLQILQELLQLEISMGRIRKHKWEPRIIDLDILYIGKKVVNHSNLIVPHPYIQERRFTLEPMAEIAPKFIHPILGLNQAQLLALCPDKLSVEKLPC